MLIFFVYLNLGLKLLIKHKILYHRHNKNTFTISVLFVCIVALLSQVNSYGHGDCGSTRPWVKSARVKSAPVKLAWSHIKPGGNVFNKKEFIQRKDV